MKTFVLWTGIISVLAGASFQVPEIASTPMPTEAPGMLMHLFGLMAIFIGGISGGGAVSCYGKGCS